VHTFRFCLTCFLFWNQSGLGIVPQKRTFADNDFRYMLHLPSGFWNYSSLLHFVSLIPVFLCLTRHVFPKPVTSSSSYSSVSSSVTPSFFHSRLKTCLFHNELECGPMPNLMVALPNIGGALCSTPQSLADAHY